MYVYVYRGRDREREREREERETFRSLWLADFEVARSPSSNAETCLSSSRPSEVTPCASLELCGVLFVLGRIHPYGTGTGSGRAPPDFQRLALRTGCTASPKKPLKIARRAARASNCVPWSAGCRNPPSHPWPPLPRSRTCSLLPLLFLLLLLLFHNYYYCYHYDHSTAPALEGESRPIRPGRATKALGACSFHAGHPAVPCCFRFVYTLLWPSLEIGDGPETCRNRGLQTKQAHARRLEGGHGCNFRQFQVCPIGCALASQNAQPFQHF